MWLNLERTADKRGRTDEIKIITLLTAMTKKVVSFFSGKNRGDTVSCLQGDTNPSDATARMK